MNVIIGAAAFLVALIFMGCATVWMPFSPDENVSFSINLIASLAIWEGTRLLLGRLLAEDDEDEI